MTTSRTFKATVAAEDENFVVKLPFDPTDVFGKARPPIVITVGDYSFRSTIMIYGGEPYIGVRKSHREAARLRPGQKVDVTVAFDDQPREVEVPPELAKRF